MIRIVNSVDKQHNLVFVDEKSIFSLLKRVNTIMQHWEFKLVKVDTFGEDCGGIRQMKAIEH